jgi:hypothetical protein
VLLPELPAARRALKSDGTVWTWGCNDRAQLGDASYSERHQPALFLPLVVQ